MPAEGETATGEDARRLRPGTLYPLVPGWELRIGEHRLLIEAALPEHFKRL